MAKKSQEENKSAYFRQLFTQHPDWLDLTENTQIIEQWKQDHNGAEMPTNVKQVMASIKSNLRKERRGGKPAPKKRGRKPRGQAAATTPPVRTAPAKPREAVHSIERLEEMIDNCLVTARGLNVEKLDKVIKHLRLARNGIVLMFDNES